jgi:predicted phage tail protein
MLRTGELVAFLFPFAVYLVWRRFSAGSGPSASMLGGTLLALALFGAALAWFGVHRALAPDAAYIPAHVVDGRIVPGHSATP